MTTTTARTIVVYVFLRHTVVSGTLGYLLERVARDHADFGAVRPEQTAPCVRGRIRIGKPPPGATTRYQYWFFDARYFIIHIGGMCLLFRQNLYEMKRLRSVISLYFADYTKLEIQ